MQLKQVYELLAMVLNVDLQQIMSFPVTEPLEKLGMDSMGMIRFILLLEDTFNIAFFNSDLILYNFSTLEKLFQTLEKYKNEEKK